MDRESGCIFRARRRHTYALHVLIFIAFLALASGATRAGVEYVYDELGRISQAINSDGSITEYRYDANGNITLINRFSASALSIATFSPSIAHVGSVIAISGSGFSTVPGENAVTIGGANAVVSGASATQLVVTVPTAAVSGAVSVTVDSNTAVSSQSITILRPVIATFSPAAVNPGTAVTVNGSSLNLVPGSTLVTVGSTAATISSVTNTKIVFPTPNASGRVHVLTSYGEAISTSSLLVVPATVPIGNVISSGLVSYGGAAAGINIGQAGKSGMLAFEAGAGDFASVQVSGLTLNPSNATISYQVYSPANVSVMSGSIASSSRSIHLPKATTGGTYIIVFTCLGCTSQFTAALEHNVDLSLATGPVAASIAATAQSRRFIFSAVVGEDVGLAITNLAVTPSSAFSVNVTINKPDGTFWTGFNSSAQTLPGGQLNLRGLPATGNYSAIVTPNAQATASFSITFSRSVVSPLTTGTPANVTLGVPGQAATLTFTATAGQTLALHVGSIVSTPASKTLWTTVYNAAGTQVASSGTSAASLTLNLPNLAGGNYKIQIVSSDAATATMQATLASGVAASVPVDSTTGSYSTTVPGQQAFFTFAATAGQDIGIAITNLAITPSTAYSASVTVYKPDGNWWNTFNVSIATVPGAQMNLRNLPATGTYKIIVVPNGQATMSFNITLSQNVTGSLTSSIPVNVNLAVPGQGASLTFAATANQTLALNVGSIASTPAGKTVWVNVYNAAGTQVAGTGSSNPSMTLNMQNLAAGNYSVVIVSSDGARATLHATLANGVAGALPADGTTGSYSTSVPGQQAFFTFSGVAGQDIGLAITNFAITPSSANAATITITKPDQNYLTSFNVSLSTLPGAQSNLRNLPATGTYKVLIVPNGQATMSFGITLSQNSTGSLTAGTPRGVSLPLPGQGASLTFAATAGQTLALNVGAITSTPAGKTVWINVYNAAGTQVAGTGSSNPSMTLNMQNLAAGNYSVVIVSSDAATATMLATLANGVAGVLPADGTTGLYSASVPGQQAFFTFSGTAGQDLGLAITSFAITPSAANAATITITKPDQNYLTSFNVSLAVMPGAQANLRKLPATGTYKVLIVPNGQATMSFGVTLSQNLTGTLNMGTPLGVNLAAPGRGASMSFAATAGQSLTLNVSSIVTTPSGARVWTTVYNAAGTQVAATNSISASQSLSLPNLAAGTYTAVIWCSDAATATMQVVIP